MFTDFRYLALKILVLKRDCYYFGWIRFDMKEIILMGIIFKQASVVFIIRGCIEIFHQPENLKK